MAQISYGSITISDITDITNLFFEYCLVNQNTTIEELSARDYFYYYFPSADLQCDQYKDYYLEEIIDGEQIYTIVDSPNGNPSSKGYYERAKNDEIEQDWSTSYPNWQNGYNVWVREVHDYKGLDTLVYGIPYLDTIVNQLSPQVIHNTTLVEALQTRLKNIWQNNRETSNYPAGYYMAAGIGELSVTESNANTYGYNMLLRHSAIQFRYNDLNLTSIGQDGVVLYYLPTIDYELTNDTSIIESKVYYNILNNSYFPVTDWDSVTNPHDAGYYQLTSVPGAKGVEITSNGLNLYRYNDSNNAAVSLTPDGLSIKNGSIFMGDAIYNPGSTSNGSIALTQQNFARQLGSQSVNNLRFAIGNNFGVTEDGVLFANNAIIEGNVIFGPFSNVYTKDDIDHNYYSIDQLNDTYFTKDEINQNFQSQIENIQIIYKTFNDAALQDESLIDSPGSTWIDGEENGWSTIRPSFDSEKPNVYYAIQTKTTAQQVVTNKPVLDSGTNVLDILTSTGEIDISKIDFSQINIGDLGGQLTNDMITGLVTQTELSIEVSNINNSLNNYVSTSSIEWNNLRGGFVFTAVDNNPAIQIYANPAGNQNSYLQLTGEEINFYINNTDKGSLSIRSEGIDVDDIRVTSIRMGLDRTRPTLGWILRKNNHLSLKVLT